jgi:hypothetical protein
MMNFDVTTTISFDIEDDLAERVLDYVLCDMWYDHPDQDDYDKLSEKQQRELIINTLETALEKYKNT